MSQETFAALGVSAESIAALAERGISSPFQIQSRAIPPALAGTDVLAKSPTGSGKTLAFAIPLVERVAARRRAAGGARPRPDARARPPGRPSEIELLATPRDLAVATVYGGVPLRRAGERARATRTSSSQRRAASRTCSTGASSRSTPSRSSSSTRPTGCSTWASSRRSTGSSSASRATARRCSSRPRSTARSASSRARTRSRPSRIEAALPTEHGPGEIEHRFVSVTPDTRSRSSSSCSRPSAGSRSSSSAPSAGPTGSPASSSSTA